MLKWKTYVSQPHTALVIVFFSGRLYVILLIGGAIQALIGFFQMSMKPSFDDLEPGEEDINFSREALCVAMVAVTRADGEFEQKEEKAILKVIKRVTDHDVDLDVLRTIANGAGRDINSALRYLNDYGLQIQSEYKPVILKACMLIIVDDGKLDPAEKDLLLKIVNALGLPSSLFVYLLRQMNQDLAESA